MAEDSSENAAKSEKSEGKSGGTFDQYEYVSVIAPGAALLMGLAYLFPALKPEIGGEHSGLASLGLLLIAAFIVGHVVAGIGELIEYFMWKVYGGMPTDWVVEPGSTIISAWQRAILAQQVTRFGARLEMPGDGKAPDKKASDDKTIDPEKWRSTIRQIYAAVRAAGRNYRVDAFNRTYGFCRNFSAAMLVLLIIVFLFRPDAQFPLRLVAGVLAIAFVITLVRTYYFGKAYGRELLVTYIELTSAAPAGAAGGSTTPAGAQTSTG